MSVIETVIKALLSILLSGIPGTQKLVMLIVTAIVAGLIVHAF
ncbi:hypothetical protein [Klebsiella aerogenes]|nr:hypothetical protein [Klebsiella aerogenes]